MDVPGEGHATEVNHHSTVHDRAHHGADDIRIDATTQDYNPVTDPLRSDLELVADTGVLTVGEDRPDNQYPLNGVSIDIDVHAPDARDATSSP